MKLQGVRYSSSKLQKAKYKPQKRYSLTQKRKDNTENNTNVVETKINVIYQGTGSEKVEGKNPICKYLNRFELLVPV